MIRNLTPEGAGALRELEGRIRNSLRERTPAHVSVETGSVAFARYEETTPDPGSTRRVALREATAAGLEALYPGPRAGGATKARRAKEFNCRRPA